MYYAIKNCSLCWYEQSL